MASYKGLTDEDYVDVLYTIDQTMPIIDPYEKSFIDNLLENYEAYGKAVFSDKQREVILSLKEKYLAV